MATYDYIIVGGGLAGSTLAGRLSELHPSRTILLLEAGPNVVGHPLTSAPLACFGAHFSPLDWAYTTVPQTHLDGRTCYNSAGKALGGGTAINYGTWTRGSAAKYDLLARMVDDEGWSYQSLLPYFQRAETHWDRHADPAVHGRAGPIHNATVSSSSPDRTYPLREPVRAAWAQLGVGPVALGDANAGHPLGLAELTENWRAGRRQIASEAYGVTRRANITVRTNTLVKRVLLSDSLSPNSPSSRGSSSSSSKTAVGVELPDGTTFHARREVILSAGGYRTPQLLMLSGIGPREHLQHHGISVAVDSPEVGRNFHDHFAFNQWWQLRHPEQGLSAGTPAWQSPAYGLGLPCDWVATLQAPPDALRAALQADGVTSPTDLEHHPYLSKDFDHLETLVVYAPAGAAVSGVDVPIDGSHIATAVLGIAPSSRGTITLASADPAAAPVIDPNYYATEVDRVTLRAGIRQVNRLMLDTPPGKEMVVGEVVRPGLLRPLGVDASDAEIDEAVRKGGMTFYHPAGSAAMGKVVDSELRVCGVRGLRVVDASVLPLSVAGHYQVALYAIAERAAELVAGVVG
ncbi:glucose dehydrogenase [Aspergillus japonicus CBS 114.51]|uniref:Glucose dehydrogenase n=1 Tax=Aspergillus japonicus CBS 114.51 TaxID=1448312 RepID=A0A8T8X9K9_ASPJA|nr:glucose dehydrogenase [Aspergillus japonicus CBS 114.51]RAH84883.1 glucose dehydrogenase [Aspergillus japonicus CBS 114.51]